MYLQKSFSNIMFKIRMNSASSMLIAWQSQYIENYDHG